MVWLSVVGKLFLNSCGVLVTHLSDLLDVTGSYSGRNFAVVLANATILGAGKSSQPLTITATAVVTDIVCEVLQHV